MRLRALDLKVLRDLWHLRGQVLACVDLSHELGLALRTLEERNQFVVLQGDGVELALCVDEVQGIRTLPQHNFQKADAVLSGDIARYFQGVFEEEQGTIIILSVPELFDTPHLQPYLRQEE